MRLSRDAILARIPHQGRMCLLDAVENHDAEHIVCTTRSHLAMDNPLRHEGVLGAALGVEYAAQAMALHCALQLAQARAARSGYLTSVRDLHLHAATLDAHAAPLRITAHRLAANAHTAMYQFTVHADAHLLLEGRLSAIMDGNAPPV